MKKSIGIALIILGIGLVPGVSLAFKVTDAQAYRLDAHTALFTLSYEYGFLNADLWMPMQAGERGGEKDFRVRYELTDGEGDTLLTTNAGVVLSSETLERFNDTHRYYVPRSERGNFMLIALVNSATPLEEGATLTVSALPFIIDREGNKKEPQYTDSSVLENFTTTLK
jgi:hypothetical protein